MTDNSSRRLPKLRERMAELDVNGFLVSSAANRRYLSGFSGSNGYLAITANDAVLATDFRYIEQGEAESPGFEVRQIRGGEAWFPNLASELGMRRVGFEADDMSVAAFSQLKHTIEEADGDLKLELVETVGVLEWIRAVKDEQELTALKRAVQIADEALSAVSVKIGVGMTEQDIAWELHKQMRERGAAGPSFDTIVAVGPNAALPHHRAGDAAVRAGEPIVIDMGADFQGYRSDLTRTFVVGEADDTFRHIYGIVLRAQKAAIDAASPGMTGEEIDSVAREVIKDAGYGDEFGHGLGHGVGLVIHERPMVVPNSKDIVENDMVFTIEPGIYISGWGGIRIEDVVVMEDGRARPLTRSPK